MTPFQVAADTMQVAPGPYDSTWAHIGTPSTSAFDTFMLSNDKLYVVLAVVLIIWIGLIFFVFRTDRKLSKLERTLDESIPKDDL